MLSEQLKNSLGINFLTMGKIISQRYEKFSFSDFHSIMIQL